jgi:hypothetical protein
LDEYFKNRMKPIPVQEFLNTLTIEEAEEDLNVVTEDDEDYE